MGLDVHVQDVRLFVCARSSNQLFFFYTRFSSLALVGAVSVAVEAILAQFSSSRTVVQKVSTCWFDDSSYKDCVLFHLLVMFFWLNVMVY